MGRRGRGDLSVEQIVAVASPILRREGERALSLRRVAGELGVTAMALYHHVDGKDALVDLVMEEVLSEALEQPGEGDWREELMAFAVRYRQVLVSNPGAGRRYIDRPVVIPATARTTIRLFQLLERGGLTGQLAAEAVDAVVLVIMGSLANDLSRPPEVRRQLLDALPAGEAERLRPYLDTYATRDPERRFRAAVDWVLGGVCAEWRR